MLTTFQMTLVLSTSHLENTKYSCLRAARSWWNFSPYTDNVLLYFHILVHWEFGVLTESRIHVPLKLVLGGASEVTIKLHVQVNILLYNYNVLFSVEAEEILILQTEKISQYKMNRQFSNLIVT